MIRRIFIIDKIGSIIFSKSFIDQKGDIQLISGFLASLVNFADQTNSGDMDSIQFKNAKFIFSSDTKINARFILEIDVDDSENAAKEYMEKMKKRFLKIAKINMNNIEINDLEALNFENMLKNSQID